MRRLITVLLTCAFSLPLLALDDTKTLLEAQTVKDALRVRLDKKVVMYQIDNGAFIPLTAGQTFVSRSPGISIAYADYNPFQIGVASSISGSVDPVSKAVNDFADALKATATTVFPAANAAEAAASNIADLKQQAEKLSNNLQLSQDRTSDIRIEANDNLLDRQRELERRQKMVEQAQSTKREKLQDLGVLTRQNASASRMKAANTAIAQAEKKVTEAEQSWKEAQALYLEQLTKTAMAEQKEKEARSKQILADHCKKLTNAIDAALKAMTDSKGVVQLTSKSLQNWQASATGRAGIATELQHIRDTATDVKTAITTAESAKSDLDALSDGKDQDICEPLSRVQILSLFNIAANIDEVIAADKKLLGSLNQLAQKLGTPEQGVWVNGNTAESDYVFSNVPVLADTMQTVTLTFTPRTFSADTATLTDGDPQTTSVVVRAGRPFVPEVGIAAIYNEIEYPQYKASPQADGTFVVGHTIDKSNVDAAMTLNFFCNCFPNTNVYPGFQIGVSKAKDYPGVLLGGVLRFSQMTRIAVSAGGMVTWYKDLSTLHKGDEVTGQDIIDKDLKRKAATGFYFGVQFTFGMP